MPWVFQGLCWALPLTNFFPGSSGISCHPFPRLDPPLYANEFGSSSAHLRVLLPHLTSTEHVLTSSLVPPWILLQVNAAKGFSPCCLSLPPGNVGELVGCSLGRLENRFYVPLAEDVSRCWSVCEAVASSLNQT